MICRLQQWVRRKIVDTPCDADAGPTASIRCPHGELFPEQAPGAKRLLVPETLWDFLHQSAVTIKLDDVMGCSAFPEESEPCATCSVELTEVASQEDCLRSSKHHLLRGYSFNFLITDHDLHMMQGVQIETKTNS